MVARHVITEARRAVVDVEQIRAFEEEHEQEDELEGGLEKDVAPHGSGDQARSAKIRAAVQKLFCRGLSTQGEGTKGIHDKIDPKHLHGSEGLSEAAGGADEDEKESNHCRWRKEGVKAMKSI